MQAFRFRLQRVLELREVQLKGEEARLEQLWAERRRMQAEATAREQSLTQTRLELSRQKMLSSSDLLALEFYGRQIERERKEWEAKLAAQDELIERQLPLVVAARGRVRLLEKLRERRKTEWRAGLDKEAEELAGDFAAAQWGRRHN